MFFRAYKFAAVWLCIFFASLPLQAQDADPILALTADHISYATGHQTLTARGNVEIVYGELRLKATRLEYDQTNELLTIEGPLFLTSGTEMTVVAGYAALSSDLKNGILQSARMVLNKQLQLSAVEINRTEGRYSQLYKAAASTCVVSELHPTPLWQVRAKRITHDQQERQLFFENAQLRVGNIPVAYIPRLRVPDPSVKRATGFLVPSVSSSSVFGTGVKIPYFIALNDYSDVLLTPFLATNTKTLEFRYRRSFSRSKLSFKGAVTNDSLTTNPMRAYLFATGSHSHSNGLKSSFQLKTTTDSTYMSQYSFSSSDSIESFVSTERIGRKEYVWAKLSYHQKVFGTTTNVNDPFVVGDAIYKKRWAPGRLGGQAALTLSTGGLARSSTGRDVTRASVILDWNRGWTLRNGMLLNTIGQYSNDFYLVNDDSTYPDPIVRSVPVAGVELRWPWALRGEKATHIIEPVTQVIWTPNSLTAVPNEDSVQVEFESTNLFSLNRFAGRDMIETGLRANVGVSYSRQSISGWRLGAAVGRVFRGQDNSQFSTASGLSGLTSDYVSAFDLTLPQRMKLSMRTVFDDDFSVAKNETRLSVKTKKMILATSLVWLEKDALAGTTTDRSEWAVDAVYDIGRNWSAEADWRYDIISAAPTSAGLTATYQTECMNIGLSLSQQFATSTTVSPSTSISLQVALDGFGSRANSSAYQRRCSAF